MAEIKVRACDMCGSTPADVWVLGKNGGMSHVDLCERCARPVQELLGKGREIQPKPKRTQTKFKMSQDLNFSDGEN